MSRKHHTRHRRSRSRYPQRLRARGESPASVRMPFIDGRGRQHDTPGFIHRGERRQVEATESEAA